MLSNILLDAVCTAMISAPRFALGTSMPVAASPGLLAAALDFIVETDDIPINKSVSWRVSRIMDQAGWSRIGPKAIPKFSKARKHKRFLVLNSTEWLSEVAFGESAGNGEPISAPLRLFSDA